MTHDYQIITNINLTMDEWLIEFKVKNTPHSKALDKKSELFYQPTIMLFFFVADQIKYLLLQH